jgi:hypothetical protein
VKSPFDTESSHSNMIAVQHTVRQMYGEAAADVANLVTPSQNTPCSSFQISTTRLRSCSSKI